MGNVGSESKPTILQPTVPDDARALLEFVDAQAKRQAIQRTNKRRSNRRRLHAVCSIRFLARDGQTVLTAEGSSRDIARTGIGILTKRHLRLHTLVYVRLRLRDDREFNLPGEIVHVRAVRGDWFLIGVRFGKLRDKRLLPPTPDAGDATPDLPA